MAQPQRTAPTLNCKSCGGAVGPDDIRCPHCGSQVATVACPKCFGMVPVHAAHCPGCGAAIQRETPGAATALACPGCRKPLAATTISGASLDQCRDCGGVWLRQEAFDHLAGDRSQRGEVMGSLPQEVPRIAGDLGNLGGVRYRPCPQCGTLMNRYNYARISGVVLDSCKQHGIWFDRDELRQVLAFIEKGGLEQSRARQLQELEEQRRLAQVPPSELPGGAWADGPGATLGMGGRAGGGLAELLGDLAGKLFWP
jgi:Zn-finger nucleic acid-binding protein/RNA polymerase subunit RPABC4/transcription elongation factor Spt4